MITRKHPMTDPAAHYDSRPKITREYCAGRKLCFHPQTGDEAKFIQERLFELGFKWRDGQTDPLYLDSLPSGTLFAENGVMSRSTERDISGVPCHIKQLDEKYLTADQAFMMAQFNKMAAQIESLTQKVTDLEAALRTHTEIDKPKRPLTPPNRGSKP